MACSQYLSNHSLLHKLSYTGLSVLGRLQAQPTPHFLNSCERSVSSSVRMTAHRPECMKFQALHVRSFRMLGVLIPQLRRWMDLEKPNSIELSCRHHARSCQKLRFDHQMFPARSAYNFRRQETIIIAGRIPSMIVSSWSKIAIDQRRVVCGGVWRSRILLRPCHRTPQAWSRHVVS